MTNDLNLASVYAIEILLSGQLASPSIDPRALGKSLAAIRPGKNGAIAYHKQVAALLSLIVTPDLHSPAVEERIHDGRGRIDVVFINAAERGYFADLSYRHQIKCPVVMFECKNYYDDVGPSEFAQLTSRLSERRGKVGFIVCRRIKGEQLVRERCRDCCRDHGNHVVVLADSDLHAMLALKASGDSEVVSRYMHEKFRPIFMDRAS